MNEDALRRGQKGAIDMIIGRLLRGEKNTAIVLPTRYGKSDVMRIVALKLWDEGKIRSTLALSPNEILRDQLVDEEKWTATFQRYKIELRKQPTIATVDRPMIRPNKNGEVFLSATIQLVQRNWELFAEWIESEFHSTGFPVPVFYDEAHTQSIENEWGQIPGIFAKAGAHGSLLTATPEREDRQRPPGFEFDTIEENEVKIWRTSPGSQPELIRVDLFEGVKRKIRLRAHYEVPFSEAFAENALCKINFVPFDIDLANVTGERTLLSQLAPARARSELGQIVRHRIVIKEGVRRAEEELCRLRNVIPNLGLFVYCGNDNDREEPTVNKHAKQIKEEFKRQAAHRTVEIMTSATEDAKDIFKQFKKGEIDVVIIKQMAGVGLDIERLKIGLDLSPTRTFAAVVQRMMRPATPYGKLLVCTWICPADVITAAHFQRIVRDQGGEASEADLRLINSYEKQREAKPPNDRWFPEGTKNGPFEDSGGVRGEPDEYPRAARFISRLPTALQAVASVAEVADAFRGWTDTEPPPVPTIRNTKADIDALRDEIAGNDGFARRYVKKRMSPNGVFKYDGARWAMEWKEFFNEAYRYVHEWPLNPLGKFRKLEEVNDLNKLTQVRDFMRQRCAQQEGLTHDAAV